MQYMPSLQGRIEKRLEGKISAVPLYPPTNFTKQMYQNL